MILHSLSKRALYLAVLLLVLALPALAQIQSGNIYGTVVSGGDKSPLPGVTVTLTGTGAPLVQTTDAQGKFHFLGLSPGTYDLKSEMGVFSPMEGEGITANTGGNRNMEFAQPLIGGDPLIKKGAPPLLDSRQLGRQTTVTLTDLE